jgi:hypothetical protein
LSTRTLDDDLDPEGIWRCEPPASCLPFPLCRRFGRPRRRSGLYARDGNHGPIPRSVALPTELLAIGDMTEADVRIECESYRYELGGGDIL